MAGMLYVLSWDLVDWIATSSIPARDMVGDEDQKTGDWLKASGLAVRIVDNAVDWHDHPDHEGGWSSPYVDTTVAIHQCKDTDRLAAAADHFFGQWISRGSRLDSTPDCRTMNGI
ncbi:hypothetical protein BC831DRAFT_551154 [Entophlyctis helioformis]|nr:hypothetical protein BC831DRAFT_551154 [Entophlyctis helioformis]